MNDLYEDGRSAGQYTRQKHDGGEGSYDPRPTIADANRHTSPSGFATWMKGFEAGYDEAAEA